MSQTLQKKPNEEIYFSMSFARQLDGAETIISVPSYYANIVSTKSGSPLPITVAAPEINTPATRVTFKVSGGTLNSVYEVTMLVRTSDDNLIQGDGLIEIVSKLK